jgi:SAM-dependent methyltransferase
MPTPQVANLTRPEGVPTIPADFDPPLRTCRLCGGRDIRSFDIDYRGVGISRCRECGVKFMNPQYTDGYLHRVYSRYNDPAQDQTMTIPTGRSAMMPGKREGNFNLIEGFVAAGRLLSIGSGSGDELRTAMSRGWSVEGFDVDAATTERLANELSVPVYSGDLTTVPLPTAAYDCVYMDQVLEHPKEPAPYLRLSHRVLRPTGVLYIGVPNIESLAAGWKTFLGKHNLKPLRGRHYDSWHHLFYYSPRTLPRILENYFGFHVLRVEGDPFPDPSGGWSNRIANGLRRRFPVLDSSFRIVARPRHLPDTSTSGH